MKSLAIFLALFAQSANVPALINELGNPRWTVRHQATLRLRELSADPDVYRQLRESFAGDLTPESRMRHRILMEDYFKRADPLYEETNTALVANGVRIKLWLPTAWIWSLPREYRWHGDRDVAAELYAEACVEMVRFGLVADPELTNNETVMRFATHLYVVEWLESYRSHEDLAALHATMIELQDAEKEVLAEYLSSVGFSGKRELRTVPPAIEDRTGEACVCRSNQTFYFKPVEPGEQL